MGSTSSATEYTPIIIDPNQVLSAMVNHDEKYSSILKTIEENTEGLENDNLDSNEKYKILVSTEFLVVRLQVLIKVEKDNLDSLMTFKDQLNPSVLVRLSNRKNKLIEKEKNVEDLINSFKSTAYIIYNTRQY